VIPAQSESTPDGSGNGATWRPDRPTVCDTEPTPAMKRESSTTVRSTLVQETSSTRFELESPGQFGNDDFRVILRYDFPVI
jgi:hypothetical protein